ncbi:MAG: FHIPEP family type III secretion protein [Planctomycetales bacterium]|nr:FHIPEP family type III secretion protein [Planctomycetales bacterium]
MTVGSTVNVDTNLGFNHRSETLLSLALLGVLVVLLVPLPPFLLDMLLAGNLGVTVLLLLVTLGVRHPLDVSVFPSLLLLFTLYRLSLNVATTRLILLGGEAGQIVQTFGNFVVGGNLIVGMVIFLILIIVQFVVITKGAGRVSEVAARFTLDALPGKQMAIDAELNAGTLDEKTARERRAQLAREAEFYGAMDGASKFVRGDAIAGLIVTAINLIGGIMLGVTNGLTIQDAVTQYSILTVGDGLVSQIPALIIATASGLLVTKAGSQSSLGHEIGGQMLGSPRTLALGAGIMFVVSLTPGLPKLPFWAMGAGLIWYVRRRRPHPAPAAEPKEDPATAPARAERELLDDFLQTDRVCVKVGARLMPLVHSKHIKGLAERIPTLRQDLTQQHGFWVPAIRIRDDLQLPSDSYQILITGREVARVTLHPDDLLAIDPGSTKLEIDGENTHEPTFGLPAKWIRTNDRMRAELAGYTVVDAPAVLITHLGETLRRYSHELLSRDDLQRLLTKLREVCPTVVDEMKPDNLRISTLHQLLIALLKDRVPVTDLAMILESALNHVGRCKETPELAEAVRQDLGRVICDSFRTDGGQVRVLVLEPRLEAYLRETLKDRELSLPMPVHERLVATMSSHWQKASVDGHEFAVLTDRPLRRALRNAIERSLPDLQVIAYTEVPRDLQIDPVAVVRKQEIVPLADTPANVGAMTALAK